MAQKKEFKTTCLGCGNVTFRPYVDFDVIMEQEKKSRVGNAAKDGALIAGTSAACFPLGCCLAADKAKRLGDMGKPKEERVKDYCQSHMCRKCMSTALKTEVVTHDV